ncbi:MAG: signal recognition particle-docking protein FtsY [Candidatus Eisenbacteria sp.]|nr:signal recognition particle-docking protein FtsY [Candidatus Eisenbacteria bacterium]
MATLWKRVVDGMRKTRAVFGEGLQQVFQRSGKIDDSFYEELEEVLLGADVGLETAVSLRERFQRRVREAGVSEPEEAREFLREVVTETLARAAANDAPERGSPHVILIVGVNGVGKTTSIGKLAWHYQQAGLRPLVVASDTYRAAALEQLSIWAERAGAELIRSKPGSDPAAVAYDGISAARARGCGVVLVDTAGRLQTNRNLMAELSKIHRVLGKAEPGAPHEVLLVLDATIGQNALSQASLFSEAVEVSGIVLAKLDGSARGGVILAIADRLGIPVRYVGLGETLEDLAEFDPETFARALLEPPGRDAQN